MLRVVIKEAVRVQVVRVQQMIRSECYYTCILFIHVAMN